MIEYLLYGNFKRSTAPSEVEVIPLLDMVCPWHDLKNRMQARTAERKFAVVCRIPTPDSTYYPIPYYASLFKGKWYNIKTLIGMAKEAKLKNTAPIKYHIEVSAKYWENIFKRECITDLNGCRSVSWKRSDALLISSLVPRTLAKRSSLHSIYRLTERSSAMFASTKLIWRRREATGLRIFRRRSTCSASPCVYTATSSALCPANHKQTTAVATSGNCIQLPRRCRNHTTTCSSPCIAS